MPDSEPYDPLTQALRNLPPAPHALSRERLLFEAGRAAGLPRFEWIWKTATAILGGATLILLGFVADPPRGSRGVEIVRQFAPAPVVALSPRAIERDEATIEVPVFDDDALVSFRTRARILEEGIDALPVDRSSDYQPSPARDRGLAELTDGLLLDGAFAAPTRPNLRK